MSRRVLKWSIPVDDLDHPIGTGKVVLVACQHGPEVVQVWTEENERTTNHVRAARVYGTGHDLPNFDEHIGSVMAANGALVWHVYATPPRFDSDAPHDDPTLTKDAHRYGLIGSNDTDHDARGNPL